jgi:hypothetical protein
MSLSSKCNFIGNLLSFLLTSIRSCRLSFSSTNLFNHYSKNKSTIPSTNETLDISTSIPQDYIEPHAYLLTKPNQETLLYKIIPSHYFFDMLKDDYLYFRRVDTYNDDKNDSEQPPKDRKLNEKIGFEKNPEFKVSNYYDRSRSRTYACCFSTENTPFLWNHYNDADNNAIRIVFDCHKLINHLNRTHGISKIIHQSTRSENFIYINYGLVKYGNFKDDILATNTLPNPIEYVYFKDFDKYSEEKEFRISLSCMGIYKEYKLQNNSIFNFPTSIKYKFDFTLAIQLGIIVALELTEQCDKNFQSKLRDFLKKRNIKLTQESFKK